MVQYGFIFDIIIVRIDTPYSKISDPKSCKVDVNFNNVSLCITSSRINVMDFRAGRSYEFESSPEDLRSEMENNPLMLQVKYNNDVVGNGCMEWPNSVLDRINESLGEFTHVDECELMEGDEKIGCIELIVRLQCKCQEIGSDECSENGDDIRKHLRKVINPQDILFVVGEKQNYGCDALLPACDENHATALDLSQYRSKINKLEHVQSTDCCELKKISNQYQQLIDTLMCSEPEDDCRRITSAKTHFNDCPHDNNNSDTSSTWRNSSENKFPCSCFASQHYDESDFTVDKFTLCPQVSPTDVQHQDDQTSTRCPVCKENLSWLPKMAACPKCGYKPVPYVGENENLSADQILQDHLSICYSVTEQPGKDIENASVDNNERSRCTCKNGKICVHCRLRKVCEDVFQSNSQHSITKADETEKFEIASSELSIIVGKTSSKASRPYLARVFSELKDLYNIKDPKRKAFELDTRCEKMLEGVGRKKIENKSQIIKTPVAKQSTVQQQKKQEPQQQFKKQQKKKKRRSKKQNVVAEMKSVPKKEEIHQPKSKPPTDGTFKETSHYGYKSESLSPVRRKVPCNMGWLWNADLESKHRGWKPGSISKPIKELMKYFLKDYPVDTLPVSKYSYRNQGKGDCNDKPDLEQKPTLHISKKNNEFIITLRPLKDRETLKECADPYLKMKPIQFKINKNPLLVEVRKLKRCLKDMGFDKCTCHRPVIECFCRSFIDKKKLEYQLKKECEKRGLQSCNETLVLSDTTDSETEFDFGVTPPAGVMKPERLNRPNLVDQGSQYVMSDWNVPPKVPMPVNKYLKNYFCATGEGRYLPGKIAGVGKRVKKPTGGAVRFKGAKGAAEGGNKEGGKGDGEAECPKGSRPPIDMLEYHNQRKALDAADKARKKEMRGKKYGMPSELLCTVMRRAKTVPCNAFARADNWFGVDRVC